MAGLTVLYDADCGVCTAIARWLERRGRDVTVAPIGSGTGRTLLRDLPPGSRASGVHAVDRLGRRATGGAAVPVILRAVPGAGALARLADAFPALTGVGYDAFAARRRTVSRALGLEACAVPGDGSPGHATASGAPRQVVPG